MSIKTKILVALLLISSSAFSQTMPSTAAAYNAPYDTLIAMGNKSVSSGLMIGASSPNLGLMFYNRAIEIAPENPIAYERKGDAYLNYNMLAEAGEAYGQCLEIDPNNVNSIKGMFLVSSKGSTRYQLTEVPQPMMKQIYNSAIAFLKVATPEMSEDAAYAELLGYAFKLGLDNSDAFQKYTQILLASDQTVETLQLAEELIPVVQSTGNNPVLASLYDKLCEQNFYSDNAVKVKEYGTKALATGYAFTTTYYYLAHAYYFTDKNTTEAIKTLELGLSKKGEYNRSKSLLNGIFFDEGKAAYIAKNYPLAIDYLSKLVKNIPDSERAQAFLGFSYYSTKKYPEAVKSLKEVKRLANPGNINIYYPNLTALITFSEKPSTTVPAPAIKTTLIEVEKNDALFDEGENLRGQKNYNQAIVKYNEALVYYTTTNDKPSMEMCFNRIGLAHHDNRNYEAAKQNYAKSIELGGTNNQSSYSNYALLLYAIDKNYVQSEQIINDGLVKYPENSSLLNMMGRMNISRAYDIYDTKDYAASIPYFVKGLEYKDDAEAYIFLGFAYNEISQVDKAVEAWDTAFYLNENLADTYPDVYKFVQSRKN